MPSEFEFIISLEDKGQRLDQFLTTKSEIGLTRSQIQKLIANGQVEVNKIVPKVSYKLKADDRVVLTIPPPQKTAVTAENIPLDVIYEDADLIVINKPRGMVVHPAAGNFSGTLVNALLAHCRDLSGIGGIIRPGIVHRLDKDTSGLIVVAKNDAAHQALAKQFKSRQVKKQYVALVHGVIKEESGRIEAPIGRHPVERKKMAVIIKPGLKARMALTEFTVQERFKNYTLLELNIKTGRTHQIRVHLNHLGRSVVGDQIYGKRKEEFAVSGQLLHAQKLGFTHPTTGQKLEFTAPLPEDMAEIIRRLQTKSGSPALRERR